MTLGQPDDAFVFLFHHLCEVEGRFDLDSQVGELGTYGRIVEFGGVQQSLGGHAADIQGGCAKRGATFDTHGFQTQLARADGGVITTGPPPRITTS